MDGDDRSGGMMAAMVMMMRRRMIMRMIMITIMRMMMMMMMMRKIMEWQSYLQRSQIQNCVFLDTDFLRDLPQILPLNRKHVFKNHAVLEIYTCRAKFWRVLV